MRILHLTTLFRPDRVGGAELFVETLAREQIKAGHNVAVAALSRRSEPARVEDDGVTVYRLGYTAPLFVLDQQTQSSLLRNYNTIATRLDPLLFPRVSSAISKFRPDIVNTHSLSNLTPLVWAAAGPSGVPVVHTLHDFTSMCVDGAAYHDGRICNGKNVKCYCLSLPHRLCQRCVSALIGVGSDILKRHYEAGFFHHVPLSRRRSIWNAIEAPSEGVRRYRKLGSQIVFGYLGRLEPSKGADFLLEALRGLKASNWRLDMAGEAPGGVERYRVLAAGLPVTFLGYMDLDAFFSRIDCLIVPPLWPEAFGRTVAEAGLRGVPVIGSAIGGVAEQKGPHGELSLFEPGDAANLNERLMAFLNDPKAFVPSSAEISALRSATDPANVAWRYLDLYGELLESRGAHRA